MSFEAEIAYVAADSFPFSGGAEIEQASKKRASEGAFATLSQFRAFGKGKETAATQAKTGTTAKDKYPSIFSPQM